MITYLANDKFDGEKHFVVLSVPYFACYNFLEIDGRFDNCVIFYFSTDYGHQDADPDIKEV